MTKDVTWPAKLLLFGEFSILLGSSALGMPFHPFSASLRLMDRNGDGKSLPASESNLHLQKLCDHFLQNHQVFNEFLDLDALSNDLVNGLFLSSTIPQCYGMGSSGALCASVYNRYGIGVKEPAEGLSGKEVATLREQFIRMESWFHGKSSGFDPLVCYLKKPLLLGKDGMVVAVDIPGLTRAEPEILLIDSGLPCSTGPHVRNFLHQFFPEGIVTITGEQMIRLTDSTIDAFLKGNPADFRDAVNRLSRFQLDNLEHLIPAHLQPIWNDGLRTGLFTLKLCGSGGGGFLTCFSFDKEQTAGFFEKRKIAVMSVPALWQEKNTRHY